MPGLHVLVLDVDEDQKLVASAISAGASGLVPDTSDEQDLVDAIEIAVAGRMVMSTQELMSILNAEREEVADDPLAKLTRSSASCSSSWARVEQRRDRGEDAARTGDRPQLRVETAAQARLRAARTGGRARRQTRFGLRSATYVPSRQR
jgi:hypothetical protein